MISQFLHNKTTSQKLILKALIVLSNLTFYLIPHLGIQYFYSAKSKNRLS